MEFSVNQIGRFFAMSERNMKMEQAPLPGGPPTAMVPIVLCEAYGVVLCRDTDKTEVPVAPAPMIEWFAETGTRLCADFAALPGDGDNSGGMDLGTTKKLGVPFGDMFQPAVRFVVERSPNARITKASATVLVGRSETTDNPVCIAVSTITIVPRKKGSVAETVVLLMPLCVVPLLTVTHTNAEMAKFIVRLLTVGLAVPHDATETEILEMVVRAEILVQNFESGEEDVINAVWINAVTTADAARIVEAAARHSIPRWVMFEATGTRLWPTVDELGRMPIMDYRFGPDEVLVLDASSSAAAAPPPPSLDEIVVFSDSLLAMGDSPRRSIRTDARQWERYIRAVSDPMSTSEDTVIATVKAGPGAAVGVLATRYARDAVGVMQHAKAPEWTALLGKRALRDALQVASDIWTSAESTPAERHLMDRFVRDTNALFAVGVTV